MTGLDTHSKWSTSLMNPVDKSREFFSDCILLGSEKRWSVWLRGFTPLMMFNLCSASSLGTSGMFDSCHAKMFQFLRRKMMGALYYFFNQDRGWPGPSWISHQGEEDFLHLLHQLEGGFGRIWVLALGHLGQINRQHIFLKFSIRCASMMFAVSSARFRSPATMLTPLRLDML